MLAKVICFIKKILRLKNNNHNNNHAIIIK